MKAISDFKINVCSMEKMDGCIICYSYPGKDDWNKKNTLTTNFCEDCNVVLCGDCFKKIDGYKCPICHKKSHLVIERQRQERQRQEIQERQRQERQVLENLPVGSVSRETRERAFSEVNRMQHDIDLINNSGMGQRLTPRPRIVDFRVGDIERINNAGGGIGILPSDLTYLNPWFPARPRSPIQRTQRTPAQENRRLRNQRYRRRKRARINSVPPTSTMEEVD